MARTSRSHFGVALGLVLLIGHAHAQAVYIGTASGANGPGDHYGHSVAQLHDVNGDGVNEFLVGAPGSDDNGTDSGAVYIIDGAHGFIRDEVHGSVAGDELGWSVANLGDVDGDGIDDFAAGRPGRDFNGADAGGVGVYSGAGGSILWSATWTKAGARAGSVVAAAGDVDGDGRSDVLVGAPDYDGPVLVTDANWGRAVLYSGDSGIALKTITGATKDDRLGAGLAGLPDLNNDGRPEFAVGAPGRETGGPVFFVVNAGACDVYSGLTKALLFSIDGGGGNEACGSSIAALGDTDHDGLNEFVVGRPGWSSDRGRVSVHEGKLGTTIQTLNGPQLSAADTYGTAVCAAGDVNKDGHVDLLVGAPCAGTGFGGYTHVLSGKDFTQYGDILNSSDVFGSATEWGFGTTIAAGLDTSEDGWVDAVFGMPLSDIGSVDKGFVWGIRFTCYQPDYDQNNLYQTGFANLQVYGTKLATGGVADIGITGAPDFTPVYLLASALAAPTNFKCGVIVPKISGALILTLLTDSNGHALIPDIPGGSGPLNIYLQALLPVPAGPQGWWITNAITMQLLP